MSESREVIYCEKGKTILDSDFKQIKRMDYHEPLGEGDAHYVDCHMTDGRIVRVFRPDVVTFAIKETD